MLTRARHHRLLWVPIFAGMIALVPHPASAKIKVKQLAQELLYGDQATRTQAVQDFNKLPSEAQYKLVPDFMVALTDEDPEVRKIASRILKAMGVKTENQLPDAAKQLPVVSSVTATPDKWAEEKKMKESTPVSDLKKNIPAPEPKTTGDDKWADLKKMQGEESGKYADMQDQIDQEKKVQVTLDASQLKAESDVSSSPLSTVLDSLKDPDPWVRAQAARRLSMIHPAPVEAIPTLITMLKDEETESRRAAAAALGSFGPLARDAVPALNNALGDSDPAVTQIAAEALKQIQIPQ